MSTRLVCTGVQAEGKERQTTILGSVDVGSTIVVRGVAVEEASGVVVVDRDTVSLNGQVIEGLGAALSLVLKTLEHNLGRVQRVSGGISNKHYGSRLDHDVNHRSTGGTRFRHCEHGTTNTDLVADSECLLEGKTRTRGISQETVHANTKLTKRLGNQVDEQRLLRDILTGRQVSLIGNRVESVPLVEVLSAGSGDGTGMVILNLHADEQVLNGPLKLLQKDLVGSLVDIGDLLTVNADQREADTTNVNFVR